MSVTAPERSGFRTVRSVTVDPSVSCVSGQLRYERIAQLETVLNLRDQRRRERYVKIGATALTAAVLAAAAVILFR